MKLRLPQANGLSEPRHYFHGIRKEWFCPVDNVVFFVRHTREALQRKTFESNQHHRFVLLVVLETPGVVSVDRTYTPLNPGQAMIILPYQFHHYVNLSKESIRWLFITFETDTPDALEEFRFQVMSVQPDAVERIASILTLARRKTTFQRNNVIVNEVESILAILRGSLIKQRTSESLIQAKWNKPIGMKILAVVNQCLSQQDRSAHTIRTIARKASISESRLRVLFLQHFGLSLGSYIRNYQIHHAMALMQDSSTALYEVASICGYTSLSTFSRAFKLHTGLTPSAFRRRHF